MGGTFNFWNEHFRGFGWGGFGRWGFDEGWGGRHCEDRFKFRHGRHELEWGW